MTLHIVGIMLGIHYRSAFQQCNTTESPYCISYRCHQPGQNNNDTIAAGRIDAANNLQCSNGDTQCINPATGQPAKAGTFPLF